MGAARPLSATLLFLELHSVLWPLQRLIGAGIEILIEIIQL